MSTKAEIQANINTKLASASSITALEHREVLSTDSDSVLGNLYSAPISESQNTGTITTGNSDFDYNIDITKIGNLVHIAGVVVSKGIGNSVVFEISDAEYEPDKASTYFTAINTLTDEFSKGIVLDGTIGNPRVQISDLFVNEIVVFNLTYTVAP